ncbi:DNA repair ATPase [Thalassotalea marina]|uniref:AAA+ ATPase domain-containing protein n=1 Tax=Thalassotalea marina TaxID=1673741 RepID=A0A919BM74_9GAMM|nr:DNA repair ATPase [Thalassotalea marina]GHF97004.1 hypothetical protein GCM10017161_26370 [Thalassotalea marina]
MAIQDNVTNQAVAEGGSYELIQRRLTHLGTELNTQIQQLNTDRINTFGDTDMAVESRVRVRTENNCVARDIAAIGDILLFGYNVFLGLKRNITVADVFSLHKLEVTDEGVDIVDLPIEGSFLEEPEFVRDFDELYTYYKKTFLAHVYRQGSKVFAIFQIGERLDDIRVFQWAIDANHQVTYIDNRGERALKQPENFDFEWQSVTRDQQVSGKFAHYNLFDTLFVECTGGNLTLKVENNTEAGEGIYSEPVEDTHQSLDDADIDYAMVGELILLKVKPYREEHTRHLIFNTKTQQVLRQDAIANSCIQLPEDHGIIFPGGYYLQNGDHKSFDDKSDNLELHRIIKSPNGEDFLYIFYEPSAGQYALFAYNLITRTLQNPIYGHGQSIYENGRAVIFAAESEPSRLHSMQIWTTPFCSEEHASSQPADNSFFGKIGNAELVRGISALYSVVKLIGVKTPSMVHFNDLVKEAKQLFDHYHWLNDSELASLYALLQQVVEAAELALDEFEKVTAIKQNSDETLIGAKEKFAQLSSELADMSADNAAQYVEGLVALSGFKGELISHKELKYIDVEAIDQIDQQLDQLSKSLSQQTADFLQQENALTPYYQEIESIEQAVAQCDAISALKPIKERIETLIAGLELLNQTMLSIDIEDSRQRTRILEDISAVFSLVNRVNANADLAVKNVGIDEARAEFGARFKLLNQSVTSALNASNTPQECDQQLSQLLIQLEELESQFSDYDEFHGEILAKRDEVYDNFEQHKQQLMDAQQKRCLTLFTAAERILSGIDRRTSGFDSLDKLNSYFAADPMVTKLRQLVEQLRALDDHVKADDVDAKLKNAKEQAVRALRDKSDIYSADGSLVKIGDHQFSVNKQQPELTLLPRDNEMLLHISGSEYFEVIDSSMFAGTQYLWQQDLISENSTVYRGEYLAASILFDAEKKGLQAIAELTAAASDNSLIKVVQRYVEQRYQEGYDKGVHDQDAVAILNALLSLKADIGLLAYPCQEKRLVLAFWCMQLNDNSRIDIQNRCVNLNMMEQTFGSSGLRNDLLAEFTELLSDFQQQHVWLSAQPALAARYLLEELSQGNSSFVTKEASQTLVKDLKLQLKANNLEHSIGQAIGACQHTGQQYALYYAWLSAFSENQQIKAAEDTLVEAACLMTFGEAAQFYSSSAETDKTVSELLGQHGNIVDRQLTINYQEFVSRLTEFVDVHVPAFKQFHQQKQQVLEHKRTQLNMREFQPKALSSFVRNKLINDVYFPIIGANLAKQIGAAGNQKRSDLMGLLLLISPPGYGKTTLIEYVASKLGMTFVKVNCPSIGHDQVSLDPEQANNSTARSEVEKINLAFEMGNNVMLYLDDIQHTHPEFLQKFISLCDGSRKVDGVWQGQSKTYDLRGKKFAVIMAGNPYTESGEAFTIPDMLANRADIYNLGDTLSGREYEFSLSFIENSLTSNRYLAPLATRDMDDLYQLIKQADGEPVNASDLKHGYSQAEVNEIIAVIKRIRQIQQTVLKTNEQYIASAAQDDKYRIEPPFKLQGSYRNMNKMAEKVVPVMTEQEIEQLIADHYRGEAQTLTVGAEENLLKLGELRNTLTPEDQHRWLQIKEEYVRHKNLGGSDNPVANIASQVSLVQKELTNLAKILQQPNSVNLSELTDAVRDLKPNKSAKSEQGHDLSEVLGLFSQQLESVFSPLAQTLADKQQLDGELVNVLSNLNHPAGKASTTKETPIQKISRELSTDNKNQTKVDSSDEVNSIE